MPYGPGGPGDPAPRAKKGGTGRLIAVVAVVGIGVGGYAVFGRASGGTTPSDGPLKGKVLWQSQDAPQNLSASASSAAGTPPT